MKSKIKKLLSMLICIAMMAGIMPVSAFAQETDIPAPVETIITTQINPLYEDIIDEDDLISPGTAAVSDVEYYTSIENAGEAVREQLKNRQDTVTVGITMDSNDSEVMHKVFDYALIHTGVPTEGDYLLWQYGGWNGSRSGYYQSGKYYFTLIYTVTYYTTQEQELQMDAAADSLLTELDLSQASDYEIVKAVYDWICNNVSYDYTNLNDDTYNLKYTGYAALINRTSVCQGYAVLLYRLLLEEGIDNRVISGYAGGAHGWNIVKLDGLYYNLDSTWDAGRNIYSYFLKSMDGFTSHVRDEEYSTDTFNTKYPMGETDYVPGIEPKVEFCIVTQPEDQIILVGETAVFAVEATGENLTYQWQYQNPGTTSWKNSGLIGNKTKSLQVAATLARNGQKYRCVITDSNENCLISNEAAMYVEVPKDPIIITKQPENYTGAAGSTAVFKVTAEGEELIYQWQYRNANAASWKNSGQSGNQTATLTVPITAARNGQSYRCIIADADGNSVKSNVATLYVGEMEAESIIKIISQPADYTGKVGSTADFKVTVEGENLTYQWQYKNANAFSWKNSGQTGNKTATLSVPITAAREGQSYRCVITDANGNSVTSDVAVLHVGEKEAESNITITSQPADYIGAAGEKATFTVAAEGEELTYQWQYKNADASTWKNSSQSGNQTAILTVPITAARNGQSYRCVITDINGNSRISEAVILLVK